MRPIELLKLPRDDRDLLQEALAKERNPRQARRFYVVLLASTLSKEKISELVGLSPNRVRNIVFRYKKNGITDLEIKKQIGRPSRIPSDVAEKIIIELKSSPYGWNAKQVRQHLQKDVGTTYCTRHVNRLMHKWGLALLTPRPRHKDRIDEAVAEFKKISKN